MCLTSGTECPKLITEQTGTEFPFALSLVISVSNPAPYHGDRLLLCVRYRVQLGHGAPQSEIVLHMLAVDVMIHCHFKYSKITTPFCQLWACGLAGDDAMSFSAFG